METLELDRVERELILEMVDAGFSAEEALRMVLS